MKLPRRRFWVPLVLLLAIIGWVANDLHYHLLGWFRGDAYYKGMPTSYWRDAANHRYRELPAWEQAFYRWTKIAPPKTEQRPAVFKGDPAASEVLQQLIRDKTTADEVRLLAMDSIRFSEQRDDIAFRLTCIDDPHPEIRLESARLLAFWGVDPPTHTRIAVDACIAHFKDPSPSKRYGAVGSLRIFSLSHPEFEKQMLADAVALAINDSNPDVRAYAQTTLADIRRQMDKQK